MSLQLENGVTMPPQRDDRRVARFILAQVFSLAWTGLGALLSLPWLTDLTHVFQDAVPLHWLSLIGALIVIAGIAYVPGYLIAFMCINVLFHRVPDTQHMWPLDEEKDVTVLIAARNEEANIGETLKAIAGQDYTQHISIVVVDNGSTDNTKAVANEAAEVAGLDMMLLEHGTPGKNNALNYGLESVETDLVITIDADTIIEPGAVRNLVDVLSPDAVAVAGSLGVSNAKQSIWTRLQHWDYFLAISSIKRLQGMFHCVLVAQGAFSLYRTQAIQEAGGWPDAIGEDIVLTWRLMRKGQKVLFSPNAIGMTEAPHRFKHFVRQRSRWARGMLEALAAVHPWHQKDGMAKFLAGVDIAIPYLDFVYTFCWIPGVVLACFGIFWLVGPMTLLVLPLTLIVYIVLWLKQGRIYKMEGVSYNRNLFYFVLFLFFYQIVMSPVSVTGYCQYWFNTRRVWK